MTKEEIEAAELKSQNAILEKVKSANEIQLKSFKDTMVEKKSFDELQKKYDELEAKRKDIKNLTVAEHKALVDEHTQFALKLKSLEELPRQKETKRVSIKDALTAAYEEKSAEIKQILEGKQSKTLVLELKNAVTITDAATIEAFGSASHWSLTSFTGIISQLRKRILRYIQSVSVGGLSIDRPYAMWIEELDEQGLPIFIAEATAKTQLSVRYEEREKKAKKIAVYGKVSIEMLRFLPQLISYIETNMMKRMDIVTEDQFFNGNDAGANLKGIIPYATAFDGGIGVAGGAGLVGQVFNVNNFDVVRAIALQVENSYGIANKVFITPEQFAAMDVQKNNQGTYMLPPFLTSDGKLIAGIELVPTPALNGTGYDFVGGDLSVVHVSFVEQPSIQIGLDGSDFTNNLKTILVEQMLVQFVSANDTQVLIKGTFAAAKTLIGGAPVL
jgi:hypothetical protein